MPLDFADVPSDGQPIRAVPPASLTSPSIPSSNPGGNTVDPAPPPTAASNNPVSGTTDTKQHSQSKDIRAANAKSRPRSSASNVGGQHVEPVILINPEQQPLQQQYLLQRSSQPHALPPPLISFPRTSQCVSSHSYNDVTAGTVQSSHKSSQSQKRGDEEKHSQQQPHTDCLTSKDPESSFNRPYDSSSSNPVLLPPSSSPPPRPPLPIASSSSNFPPPPLRSSKQSDRDHSPTPPPVPPLPASHQALTIQDRPIHRFSASSIG